LLLLLHLFICLLAGYLERSWTAYDIMGRGWAWAYGRSGWILVVIHVFFDLGSMGIIIFANYCCSNFKKLNLLWPHFVAVFDRDVVSVETSRSRDVLTSRLGLEPMRLRSCLGIGAISLSLGKVGLVSGLGPLRLVETFCAGACRAYCSCS